MEEIPVSQLAVLAVFARAPRAGEAKTRLAPALGEVGAARLYEAFLADSLATYRSLAGIETVILCTPGSAGYFAAVYPDVACIPQRGEDLGERLGHALDDVAALGIAAETIGAIGVIGSDHPSLPLAIIEAGFSAVAGGGGSGVAIGPAADGGYYLLVLGREARASSGTLFRDIAWSTETVCAATLARAAAAGIPASTLPEWYDVDTPADLARLVAEFAADASLRQRASRTAAVLAASGLLGA